MHKNTLKKLALALTFWLALYISALKAQVLTVPMQASTTGTNPVDFEFRADGTLISKGNIGVGTLLSTDQGAGTRLFWLPSLAAFRAGRVDSGSEWDISRIGKYSVAFGFDNTASGTYSAAFGTWNTASGAYSTAFGCNTTASGPGSTALGYDTVASGGYTLATGCQTTASGYFATTSGLQTTASGNYSSASGYGTMAAASHDFVVGRYNSGGGTASSWVATDPLFEIGNGADLNHLSDAVIVYKNGNAAFQGVVTFAPGGDIPMYSGN